MRKKETDRIPYNYEVPQEDNIDVEYVRRQTVREESQISGNEIQNRRNFDYRITLRNSINITNEEAIAFIHAFVSDAIKKD